MKNKIVLMLALMFVTVTVKAQAVPAPYSDLQALEQWLATQQGHVGTGFGLTGIKYATTWYDLINIGQSGINIAKPGAKDFIDLGPGMNVANAQTPRYGVGLPVHVGNIYNSLGGKLPSSIVTHINLTSLPNIVLAPQVLYPQNGGIGKWSWKKDFLLVLAYSFGGS